MKLLLLASFLLAVSVLNLEKCDGYRILAVFPMATSSHFVMFKTLSKGLANKGHQVDVVSFFPLKKPHPNYTDIIELTGGSLHPLINNITFPFMRLRLTSILQFFVNDLGNDICEFMGHPKMLKLLRNPPTDPPYDLVLTEACAANCFMALGHHFKVPTIGVSSNDIYPWGHEIIGNPDNLAIASNMLLDYVPPLSFWQRFYNKVHAMYSIMYFHYYTRCQDDIIKRYLGEDTPGVREAERRLSIMLVNSHPSINGARPYTPANVEVGGLHIQDDDVELPRDLKEWMDNCTQGFVYFTFGSMIQIETFPEEFIKVLYKSLAKIDPIKVLIKIPNLKKLIPGMPKNFRTFKWTSQYQVLKHKNVKAFITHGGLMGTQESIYFGVPMIGIPLFADQFINIHRYVSKKIAVELDWEDMTEKELDNALKEILYNPIYKKTVLDVSERFRDRPMSPLDTAIFWVEYIIHHGSDSLRSAALDLSWWQIELLDVYCLLLLIVALSIFTIIIVIRFIIKKVTKTNRPKVKYSKKVE